MQKTPRAGYNCYQQAVTLTFRKPTTYRNGMYNIAYFMSKQSTIRDYVFYPEYGEQGNFHLHGTMWFTNKVHFFSMMNVWKRYVGFIKLKQITNNIGWHVYCLKDQHLIPHRYKRCDKLNTQDILRRYHPIIVEM